jgi:arsenate reductase (glutaredoxin)
MIDRVYNVLFLCTGNSARSILAEAILSKDGAGRFRAFSAGSQPKGSVNPFALQVLASRNYPTAGLRSKSWEEFARPGAPVMDFVFTVCDNAANETCPVWPGQPMTAHWGVEDPAAVEGTDVQMLAAFEMAFYYLEKRISLFRNLPIRSLDELALGTRLDDIGRTEGSGSRGLDLDAAALDVIIYHNRDCGTSRNVLGLIRNTGVEPHIIEYMTTPPTRVLLRRLVARMGVPLRSVVRDKEPIFRELGLDKGDVDDESLLDAIEAHPILVNRPIVVSPKGIRLCRPSELVIDLLPPQKAEFFKEDGERVVDERGRQVAAA